MGDLVPNQDGHWITWFHRPYHVQTNAVGLRNTEAPHDGAFRVLALGDSQTFGAYLANEDSWPAWTENALRRRLRTKNGIQVFNAGVSGYTILDELALLRDKGVRLEPRLVLIAVFENDLFDLRYERDGRGRRPLAQGPVPGLSKRLQAAGEWIALVSVVRDLRRGLEFARHGIDIRRGEANPAGPGAGATTANKPDVPLLTQRYHEIFAETVALLRANGIALGVFFIPSEQQVASRGNSIMEPVIREVAFRHSVPLLSLVEDFRAVPDAATRLYLLQEEPVTGRLTGNGHLSREGNAVIGASVAQWVLESGLVPEAALAGGREP
jgi:lysophospholipase L1-like esterase